jgi:hypothetical protein
VIAPPTGEAVLRAWLATLPDERRAALARRYAEAARADGAFVTLADGSEVPIPPILTPLGIARARLGRVSADAHALTAALVRQTAALMSDPTAAPLRARLFGAFTPLEAEALATTWRLAANLATVRVDFLVDPAGRHRALEVNATIPAMQGYSDAIAGAFLRAVAAERGLPEARAARLVDDNGRNSDDLLASLRGHHARLGGDAERPMTIAIVARAGDAQRGELEHYVRRWSALGHRAFITTPDAVRRDGGRGLVGDVAPDLFYRHIFARRLDAASEFARMCLDPERYRVLNPIASHLEVKAMLGLLSAAAAAAAAAARLGLDDAARDSILRTVPWTRLYATGATTGPDGAPIAELGAWVRAHGPQLVLKRSWDYGGKGVYLGAELDGEATQSRLRALTGSPGAVGWAELCDFALRDGDAWVVQELVHAERVAHLRVEATGPVERALYVDLSAFTNCGNLPQVPAGGAVRASESRIVNILGGGGLAPLVLDEVLAELSASSS